MLLARFVEIGLEVFYNDLRKEERNMEREMIMDKIQKLLNLASNNPSEEEARAAMLKAQEFMLKYHIDNPETIEEDEVVDVIYDLGFRSKTDFVLLISALAAENFRSKTLHCSQRIHFFGFKPDAEAAREVFSFLLKYGDASHDDYFKNRSFTRQSDIEWRYGYIIGLYQAFNSRKGFELMRKTPVRVMDVYESINKEGHLKSDSVNEIKSIDGAFTDGFNRGKQSLDLREIGG